MDIQPFELERYFAKYEFSSRYLLSSSDCDGLPMSQVLSYADDETKALWDNLTLGYTESQGLPLLRREIAALYRDISPEQVLEAMPEEGIFLAMNAILRPGDHVICAIPGYQSLYQVAESIGCALTGWQPDESQGWRFAPDVLRESITPATKLIVVNFPHNPTGYLPSQQDYAEIVDIAREHSLYLFSDEMYRLLEYDDTDRLPSAVELYECAVSLFGMSKTFGMAGVRTGWVVTRDAHLLRKMATLKDYTTICPPAPSEILTLIGLRAKDGIIAGNLAKIRKNLTLLDAFFARHSHLFSWVRPRAGTIAFVRLLGEESASGFCRRVVEEAGIMLMPSSVYGYGDKHVRIGFGRGSLAEVLGVLEEYLGRRGR